MNKHANISIFIPHSGCPHRCSFCNQNVISGAQSAPSPEEVRRQLCSAVTLLRDGVDAEIAFFGGSFTAIDRDYMKKLLSVACEFTGKYGIRGIRVSTRPDAIDQERLDILKNHNVTAIELGAQSMDDGVLSANFRGHTAEDTVRASRLIKDYGFSLGLQMMTGLYTDTDEKAVKTAKSIAELSPDTVRIYPTLVFPDTYLAKLYREGKYSPQSLEDTVILCEKISRIFIGAGIKIIRMGLHYSDGVKDALAGPYHPAFGELVESRAFLLCAVSALSGKEDRETVIYVAPSELSKMLGQKSENLKILRRIRNVTVKPDSALCKGLIAVKEKNKEREVFSVY